MSIKHMFLYWGSGSPPCWRTMIVLAEKGLWKGLPNKRIYFSSNEHKPELQKLNPRIEVPTFRDGDLILRQSGAICMYLEENYSNDGNRLLPTDRNGRALCFQMMFESPNIQDRIVARLYYRRSAKPGDVDPVTIATENDSVKQEIDIWDKSLKGKDYLCGNKFTLADVFAFPYLAYLGHHSATFSAFPDLQTYFSRVASRPSVQTTWPPHWKEEGKGSDFMNML